MGDAPPGDSGGDLVLLLVLVKIGIGLGLSEVCLAFGCRAGEGIGPVPNRAWRAVASSISSSPSDDEEGLTGVDAFKTDFCVEVEEDVASRLDTCSPSTLSFSYTVSASPD